MTGLSRRDVLRLIVITGAAALLVPLERLTGFLFAERNVGPVTYPRERVSNTADIAVNGSLFFEYPHKDRPAIVVHLSDGRIVAYDATCTHLGCQVHYDEVAAKGWEANPEQVFCPCHGGVFDPQTGKVLGGPALRPLPKIKLEIDDNGDIYANGYESGLPLYGEG
jgi:arsenite oxidase small subunit